MDVVARMVAERLGPRIGQTITVDNKPGAGATLGGAALARSVNDGYTIMLGSIVDYAIAPHVHKSLAFEMARDFSPIVEVGFGTVILVVNADVPARNVADLIALAKAKPGSLSYASSGLGGLQHLNAEMFKTKWPGLIPVHVLYVQRHGAVAARFVGRSRANRDRQSSGAFAAHSRWKNARAGGRESCAFGDIARRANDGGGGAHGV